MCLAAYCDFLHPLQSSPYLTYQTPQPTTVFALPYIITSLPPHSLRGPNWAKFWRGPKIGGRAKSWRGPNLSVAAKSLTGAKYYRGSVLEWGKIWEGGKIFDEVKSLNGTKCHRYKILEGLLNFWVCQTSNGARCWRGQKLEGVQK